MAPDESATRQAGKQPADISNSVRSVAPAGWFCPRPSHSPHTSRSAARCSACCRRSACSTEGMAAGSLPLPPGEGPRKASIVCPVGVLQRCCGCCCACWSAGWGGLAADAPSLAGGAAEQGVGSSAGEAAAGGRCCRTLGGEGASDRLAERSVVGLSAAMWWWAITAGEPPSVVYPGLWQGLAVGSDAPLLPPLTLSKEACRLLAAPPARRLPPVWQLSSSLPASSDGGAGVAACGGDVQGSSCSASPCTGWQKREGGGAQPPPAAALRFGVRLRPPVAAACCCSACVDSWCCSLSSRLSSSERSTSHCPLAGLFGWPLLPPLPLLPCLLLLPTLAFSLFGRGELPARSGVAALLPAGPVTDCSLSSAPSSCPSAVFVLPAGEACSAWGGGLQGGERGLQGRPWLAAAWAACSCSSSARM